MTAPVRPGSSAFIQIRNERPCRALFELEVKMIGWFLKVAAPAAIGTGFLALLRVGDASNHVAVTPIEEVSLATAGDDGTVVIDGREMIRL